MTIRPDYAWFAVATVGACLLGAWTYRAVIVLADYVRVT